MLFGISNIYAFSGIVFLYFIPPFLKEPEKMKKICLISIGVTAIYLILCVSAILFMFSFFMNANEITPLYNATRYIEFGNFFQRLEAVFLLIWIIAFACYLSIISKFTMNIFRKMTNISTKRPLIDIFGLLILGTSLIPKNVAMSQNFEGDIYKYLVLAVVFGIGFTILILANLKKRRKEKIQSYE